MKAPPTVTTLPVSRLGWRRWLGEIILAVGARPLRVALTVAGTVLGIATLVAVLGLTTSAQSQISDRFSFLRATAVEIQASDPSFGTGGFAAEGVTKVNQIDGVNAAGTAWEITTRITASKTLIPNQLGTPPSGIGVYAASSAMLDASHASLRSGRPFDEFCVQRACHVAVLGKVAADRLGITQAQPDVHIFLNGQPFQVVGIVEDMSRNTPLLGGVIIPASTALTLWGTPPNTKAWMTLDTRIGAASAVAAQAPYALRPERLDAYTIITPPDPQQLQQTIGSDLTTLFLALASITLLVGAFGITNLTTVSVMERIPEIGLRRALGATPRHIAAQFVGESSFLGLIGGLIGAPAGIVVVIVVCLARQWTAVVPPWLLTTPILGLLIGLTAGIYPAFRAARIEPVAALQR